MIPSVFVLFLACDRDGFGPYRDCRPYDSMMNPDAEDRPYDGKDQDCDGSDLVDVDRDGYAAAQADGPDCDDEDPSRHPGVLEDLSNHIDEDCDGTVDEVLACPDGTGHTTTIRAAVDLGKGTVELCPGVWEEAVDVHPYDPVVIVGMGASPDDVIWRGKEFGGEPLHVQSADVTVRRVRFEAAPQDDDLLVNLWGGTLALDQVKMEGRCTLYLHGSTQITSSWLDGCTVEGASNLSIERSRLRKVHIGVEWASLFSLRNVLAIDTDITLNPDNAGFSTLDHITAVGGQWIFHLVGKEGHKVQIDDSIFAPTDTTLYLGVDPSDCCGAELENVPKASMYNVVVATSSTLHGKAYCYDTPPHYRECPIRSEDLPSAWAEASAGVIRAEVTFEPRGAKGSYATVRGVFHDAGAFGGEGGDWYLDFPWPLD